MRSLKQDPGFRGDFAETGGEGVEAENESFSKSVFQRSAEKEQNVLGMLWNHSQDELIYDLSRALGVLMLNQ